MWATASVVIIGFTPVEVGKTLASQQIQACTVASVAQKGVDQKHATRSMAGGIRPGAPATAQHSPALSTTEDVGSHPMRAVPI